MTFIVRIETEYLMSCDKTLLIKSKMSISLTKVACRRYITFFHPTVKISEQKLTFNVYEFYIHEKMISNLICCCLYKASYKMYVNKKKIFREKL